MLSVRGYNILLYLVQTYWYRDRYKVLIERRTVLYGIGTIKSWVRDFWYGIIVYRIMDLGEWYKTVLYRIQARWKTCNKLAHVGWDHQNQYAYRNPVVEPAIRAMV